ncbi:MAG: GNAT family N-acetyltransferase [Candidatus Pacebacteria bacterium]|nr:GNAT family N-acetyltransferase [Candidatus Paceibacterota bacterium]
MKKDIKIRKAKEIDIEDIERIHKSCIQKTNAKIYDQKVIGEWIEPINFQNIKKQFESTKWFVLEKDNKIVGFAQIALDDDSIYQINIDTEYQKQGLGVLLYKFLEKEFKKNNTEKINLNSTLNAIDFYKQLGFKEIKPIKLKLKTQEVKMVKMEKLL